MRKHGLLATHPQIQFRTMIYDLLTDLVQTLTFEDHLRPPPLNGGFAVEGQSYRKDQLQRSAITIQSYSISTDVVNSSILMDCK